VRVVTVRADDGEPEELLNSRARDVEEMRLLSTLCSFAENADEV